MLMLYMSVATVLALEMCVEAEPALGVGALSGTISESGHYRAC